MAALQLKNLHFAYSREAQVLYGIDLDMQDNDRIFIAGENGSGKSTLFRCITGLEKIAAGEIYLDNARIQSEKDFIMLRRKVGYIIQNSEDQLFFPVVLDDVSFGPLNLGLAKEEAEERALETLKLLGISHLARRNSAQLSGGEQKLAAIAAIMAMRPAILLLDEPFNGLDKEKASIFINALANSDCGIIIVSHAYEYISALNPEQFKLKDGRLLREKSF